MVKKALPAVVNKTILHTKLLNKTKKIFNNKVSLVIITSLVTGLLVYYFKPTFLQLSFPYSAKLIDSNNYSCEALVGSAIYGEETENLGNKRGIFAEVFKGTDKIAVEIENDKLYFLTKAALESGIARDDSPFKIIENSKENLTAIDLRLNQPARDINIFTLNKNNGIAVWSKTKAEYMLTKNPASQSHYLICH